MEFTSSDNPGDLHVPVGARIKSLKEMPNFYKGFSSRASWHVKVPHVHDLRNIENIKETNNKK